MKTKICSFAVNFIHACIISNNFIKNNLENAKVIYINEEHDKLRIYDAKSLDLYTQLQTEYIINEYEKEQITYVIYGSEVFINKVNKFLNINNFKGYIINNYNIVSLKRSVQEIIDSHKYYINTSEIYYSKEYAMKNQNDKNMDII